jgi:hypothetical protein
MSGGILVACLPVARIFYQLVSQSRTASRVAVLFSKITSRSTLETIESSSTRVASNSGSTTQQHERYKTTPKQGKSWMKAYGVTSTLFSRAESDSVTGLRSESHDSPFDHDIYQPSEVHRRDGVERTAGNAYSQSHGQSFELGSVAPAG